MLEARAKSSALTALKGAANLSYDEWIKHECQQFKQITAKLIASAEHMDRQLYEAAQELEALRKTSQDDRHQIVHAMWGATTGGAPTAYDVPRKNWLGRIEIQRAITSNEATDRVAYECVWLTAKLVEEGVIRQRTDGAGPAMRLASGLWKW